MAAQPLPVPAGWRPRALNTDTNTRSRALTSPITDADRAGARRLSRPVPGPVDQAPEPIGINKPLTVELMYLSTGTNDNYGWDDLLVTSTIKKLPVFAAAPRAVNAVIPSLRDGLNDRFDALSANIDYTPVIYHSPAQSDRGVVVTVELVWNHFKNDVVQGIGNLIASAAGIPLFAPAAGYLFAGSILVKALGNLFERTVDGKAFFTDTLTISLNRPGLADTPASFHVLYDKSIAIDRLLRSEEAIFDPDRGLVNRETHEPYTLTDPYAVVLVSGNPRPDYAKFTQTMATAALLETFLHQGKSERPFAPEILGLLGAVNSITFRNRAAEVLASARALGANEADRLPALRAEFDALNKNISDESLRLPWPF